MGKKRENHIPPEERRKIEKNPPSWAQMKPTPPQRYKIDYDYDFNKIDYDSLDRDSMDAARMKMRKHIDEEIERKFRQPKEFYYDKGNDEWAVPDGSKPAQQGFYAVEVRVFDDPAETFEPFIRLRWGLWERNVSLAEKYFTDLENMPHDAASDLLFVRLRTEFTPAVVKAVRDEFVPNICQCIIDFMHFDKPIDQLQPLQNVSLKLHRTADGRTMNASLNAKINRDTITFKDRYTPPEDDVHHAAWYATRVAARYALTFEHIWHEKLRLTLKEYMKGRCNGQ